MLTPEFSGNPSDSEMKRALTAISKKREDKLGRPAGRNDGDPRLVILRNDGTNPEWRPIRAVNAYLSKVYEDPSVMAGSIEYGEGYGAINVARSILDLEVPRDVPRWLPSEDGRRMLRTLFFINLANGTGETWAVDLSKYLKGDYEGKRRTKFFYVPPAVLYNIADLLAVEANPDNIRIVNDARLVESLQPGQISKK